MLKFVNIPLSVLRDAEAIGISLLKNISCWGGSGGSGLRGEAYLMFNAEEFVEQMNAIIDKATELRKRAEDALKTVAT